MLCISEAAYHWLGKVSWQKGAASAWLAKHHHRKWAYLVHVCWKCLASCPHCPLTGSCMAPWPRDQLEPPLPDTARRTGLAVSLSNHGHASWRQLHTWIRHCCCTNDWFLDKICHQGMNWFQSRKSGAQSTREKVENMTHTAESECKEHMKNAQSSHWTLQPLLQQYQH